MAYWLMKSEPEAYSWDDLVRDGRTEWDGVRNHQACNNMKAMNWRRLCRLDDIADGEAKGFETASPDEPDFFVVRKGEAVHGYLNDCPHWNAPLDLVPDRFMNREKGQIQCANHGARFRIETGECVFGPCRGEALTRVPVKLVDGEVRLAPGRLERAAPGRWRLEGLSPRPASTGSRRRPN